MLALSLALCCVLGGCAAPVQQRHTATFLGLFDTVTTVVGRSCSEAEFRALSRQVYDELLVYHRLFDAYHDYEGICNVKTVNDRAGIEAVAVDEAIIELLEDCRRYAELTGGKVNVAMGAVTRLWKERASPDEAALLAAAAHTDMADVLMSREGGWVYLADSRLQLDVGAVAKGWAAQRVAQKLPENILISVGGNVCAGGSGVAAEDAPWVVGVQNPDGAQGEYLCRLRLRGGCVVTSGDDQRGSHIIDPDTLQPPDYWRSVTVVCGDSALADALSTALFLLPRSEGEALAQQCGAAVLWVGRDGEIYENAAFGRLEKEGEKA